MVAEKGSKVVGFMRCSVVDGNESMVIEAARVDPSHGHYGIYSPLISFLIGLTREEIPTLVRLRYSLWSGIYKAVKHSAIGLRSDGR